MIVTNSLGEIIEWSKTMEEALNKGFNVDCFNCSECEGCYDCSNCFKCSECSGCFNCSNCNNCNQCHYSNWLSDCQWCSNSCRLTECSRCYWCSDCFGQPITNIVIDKFTVCFRNDYTLKINSNDFSLQQWMNFSDMEIFEIFKMDENCLKFWNQFKPVIEIIYNNNKNL
jgi:hypothetical protein